MDTFSASNSGRHPTDLAGLSGARLVAVSETEKGKAWAESKIKSVIGGDPITARFMRQDFFVYEEILGGIVHDRQRVHLTS